MTAKSAIPRKVHLVGVGGAHMSAIARILLTRGHEVSGSDINPSAVIDDLRGLGLVVAPGGHNASNVGDAELVAHTTAVREDNDELKAARQRSIETITRGEMVARLLAGLRVIAVAGSHGKTTTSSLIAFLLDSCAMSPTYLLGGQSLDLGQNAAAGDGDWAVVEADEYGRAFLEYEPEVAVILNVDPDHLDYFGDYESLKLAFGQFLERVKADGLIIAATGNEGLDDVLERSRPAAGITRYGLNGAATWKAFKVATTARQQSFQLIGQGHEYGSFEIGLAGRHNVLNTTGALAAAIYAGADLDLVRRALPRFRGARRRFEFIGESGGVLVYDSYAHHPSEIRADVAAARERFPSRRLVVLFQPHTYSRTRYLLDEFKTCFEDVDRLLVLATYAARETSGQGLDASELAASIRSPVPTYVSSHEEAVATLHTEVRRDDIVFTMGAGDVDRVGPGLLAAMGESP
jgi:UDP-N-acetylmuramate--alanine ligase